MATAEFSRFAGILSAALSQHHLLGFEIAQLEFHHLHCSQVMLKILQAKLQQYMNLEIPDVQAGFTKGRGTRDQIANSGWIIEKVIFALLTMPKHLTVWITKNYGKFLNI